MSEEFDRDQEIEEPEELRDIDEAVSEQNEAKAAKTGGKAAPAKVETKKKAKKKNRVARWFREMRSELKKVVWPTPKQIANNTGVALVVMIASGIVIWAVDQVGSQIFRMLITLGR